jgi:hypothetical protein
MEQSLPSWTLTYNLKGDIRMSTNFTLPTLKNTEMTLDEQYRILLDQAVAVIVAAYIEKTNVSPRDLYILIHNTQKALYNGPTQDLPRYTDTAP